MGLFGWRSCCLSARLNARLSLGMALKEPGEVPGTRTAVHHINEPRHFIKQIRIFPSGSAQDYEAERTRIGGSASPLSSRMARVVGHFTWWLARVLSSLASLRVSPLHPVSLSPKSEATPETCFLDFLDTAS